MVQRAVKFFADPRSIATDAQKRDLVRLFVSFEELVGRGLVEPAGQQLAAEFLDYARKWIEGTPKLAALYKELRPK